MEENPSQPPAHEAPYASSPRKYAYLPYIIRWGLLLICLTGVATFVIKEGLVNILLFIAGMLLASVALALIRAKVRRMPCVQFSLRTLFILTAVCAVIFAIFGWWSNRARQQRAAVALVTEVGCQFQYDGEPDRHVPKWLINLLGVDYFVSLKSLIFSPKTMRGEMLIDPPPNFRKITDTDLERLKGLTVLRELHLDDTRVTDSGLQHLKGLTGLRELSLYRTQVTDAGLEHLKNLPALQKLNLSDTHVTDAGLEQLKGLPVLQEVYLNDTQVTDTGVERLKGLTALHSLGLNGTQVTDTGLKHLQALPALRWLSLYDTRVTDAGIEHLKGFPALENLDLNGTQVSDAAARSALPRCNIFPRWK